jgi:hypothetical protein
MPLRKRESTAFGGLCRTWSQIRDESGCPDSNRGPPPPKGGALPGCATPRLGQV